MRNRSTVRLGRHLEKNLLAYVAAAGAGLLSTALPAEAEIIYTPSNTPVTTARANQGPVYTTLDLNNDGVPDFTFALSSTLHFSSYGYTSRARFILKASPDQTMIMHLTQRPVKRIFLLGNGIRAAHVR